MARVGGQGLVVTRPDILSHHLWGFLGSHVVSHVMSIYESCASRQGLEVWRKLLKEHARKTPAECLQLGHEAMNPKQCTHLGDVEASFLRWETALRKYHDTLPLWSTERLSEQRQLRAVTRMLPNEIQRKVCWDHRDAFNTPYELRGWVLNLARSTRHLDAKSAPSRIVVLVGSLDELDDEETRAEVLALTEQSSDADINAVVQRRGFKRNSTTRRPGGQPGNQQPPRESRLPENLRDTCPNCLKKGHTAQQCPEKQVARDQRKCFLCKETGHTSRNCPKAASKGRVAQVSDGTAAPAPSTAAPPRVLCLDQGDFVPAQRTSRAPVATPPKPVGARPLSAFVTPSRFAGFSQAERKQRWRNFLADEAGTAMSTNCDCSSSNCATSHNEEPSAPTATAASFPQPRHPGTGDTAKLFQGIQAAMDDRDEIQEEKERAQAACRLSQGKKGARGAGAASSNFLKGGSDLKTRGAREAGASVTNFLQGGTGHVAEGASADRGAAGSRFPEGGPDPNAVQWALQLR